MAKTIPNKFWLALGAAAGGALILRRITARRFPAFDFNPSSRRSLALITGASSGIGEAFARQLAALGSDLILLARRQDRLEALAADLRSRYPVDIEVLPADLTANDDLQRLEKRIFQANRLDLLVNNAGFGIPGQFAEAPIDEQLSMVQVHVIASMRLARAALPAMVARGRGAIINVSSVSAFAPMPGNVTYGATKAYLNAFSESLQAELRGTGVRVQALCPGFTYTEFHDTPYFPPGWRRTIPPFAWMSASQVASASLNALTGGEVIYIPGMLNQILAKILRIDFIRPVIKMVVARFRQ